MVRIELETGRVVESIRDPVFNDLHQLHPSPDGLVLANTGNESADLIDLRGRSIDRLDLLGPVLRVRRPSRSQREDTKPHLHHLSSACFDDSGALLLGLGRQARILDAARWAWIGPRFEAPLHDLCCDKQGGIWCTTVDGTVHQLPVDGSHRRWSLAAHQEVVGWTRGLAITPTGLLVGTTAVRDSNRDYFRSLTRSRVGRVDACLNWIPFDGGPSAVLELPGVASQAPRHGSSQPDWHGSRSSRRVLTLVATRSRPAANANNQRSGPARPRLCTAGTQSLDADGPGFGRYPDAGPWGPSTYAVSVAG